MQIKALTFSQLGILYFQVNWQLTKEKQYWKYECFKPNSDSEDNGISCFIFFKNDIEKKEKWKRYYLLPGELNSALALHLKPTAIWKQKKWSSSGQNYNYSVDCATATWWWIKALFSDGNNCVANLAESWRTS